MANITITQYENILNNRAEAKVMFIIRLLQMRTSEITTRIANRLAIEIQDEFDVFRNLDIENLLNDFDILLSNLDDVYSIFSDVVLQELHSASIEQTRQFFKDLSIAQEKLIDAKKISELIIQTKKLIDERILNEVKAYRDFFFRSQSGVNEESINEAIAKGILSKQNIKQSEKELLNLFKSRFQNNNYIIINNRQYDIYKYTQLLTRTRSREAQTIATIEISIAHDVKLFRFSKHPESCKICRPFENKIIYIYQSDYKENRAHISQAQPPLHPHCRHVLIPYVDIDNL